MPQGLPKKAIFNCTVHTPPTLLKFNLSVHSGLGRRLDIRKGRRFE